jgi:hypothetical protein
MLEKMSKQLVVNVNNDIGTLKRIKRRIWIERIVIGLIAAGVLITGGWLGSKLALMRGARFIRYVMLGVLALLVVTLIVEML